MRKGLWKSIYSLLQFKTKLFKNSKITNSQNLDRLTYKSDTTVLVTAEKCWSLTCLSTYKRTARSVNLGNLTHVAVLERTVSTFYNFSSFFYICVSIVLRLLRVAVKKICWENVTRLFQIITNLLWLYTLINSSKTRHQRRCHSINYRSHCIIISSPDDNSKKFVLHRVTLTNTSITWGTLIKMNFILPTWWRYEFLL